MRPRRERVLPSVFSRGGPHQTQTTQFFLVKTRERAAGSRFGVIVSRGVDRRSVRRNRIKRLICEASRVLPQKPIDMLVIARTEAKNATLAEMKESFLSLKTNT